MDFDTLQTSFIEQPLKKSKMSIQYIHTQHSFIKHKKKCSTCDDTSIHSIQCNLPKAALSGG